VRSGRCRGHDDLVRQSFSETAAGSGGRAARAGGCQSSRVVREARADDADAFVRAHEEAWDATLAPLVGKRLGELASFEARRNAFLGSLERMGQDARAWVAERDGEIVGIAVYRREDDTTGELKDLYVVPTAWGSGVARALIETAIGAMRDRGLSEATLWVAEPNSRARRFYEREGWTADGKTRAGPLGSELRYRIAFARD
jgi:GNAT superfamily N-acetyltransferase